LASLSVTFGMIQKDELIITEGELITDEKYNILNSLKTEYSMMDEGNFFNRNLNLYGQIILVALVFLSLFYAMKLLRPDLLKESSSLNMILVMMLMMIVPSFLVIKYYPDMIYMMPLPILAMLMVTFFDTKMAIYIQILTLIIISLAVPNSFSFFVIQFFVSLAAIFVLARNTSRSRYFVTYASIFISYIILKLGASLIFEGELEGFTWDDVGIFAMNTLFTMLTLPLSYLFERVFGFVTNMTLLELSNTNSPLLRKFASEAPGTFQHVMQVADLCEEALFAIGGNMLLARTGAMYHDVGKLKNPFYFTENQSGKYNLHEDLSYYESSQIIINHVIDGIEICRKYHVPEQIIDFVRTHHGTRRTEYFYQMELKENPGEEINEADFRYHGPIPFSKETAVLMMADSVEAASRSLKDKTEESISKLVDGIIDAQTKDNQFINTDLTFRDITTIKRVFKKKLMNIYHVRIAYPV
jgi:putative nucleotidyltransferase with HDIG domain